jgi:hypothetical protein
METLLHLDSLLSFLIITAFVLLCAVWLFFPFLVMSRLTKIHKELARLNQQQPFDPIRAIEAINSIAINASGTERNTRKLADFFEGRRVELNQPPKEGA